LSTSVVELFEKMNLKKIITFFKMNDLISNWPNLMFSSYEFLNFEIFIKYFRIFEIFSLQWNQRISLSKLKPSGFWTANSNLVFKQSFSPNLHFSLTQGWETEKYCRYQKRFLNFHKWFLRLSFYKFQIHKLQSNCNHDKENLDCVFFYSPAFRS
jgi:hypothetical protein